MAREKTLNLELANFICTAADDKKLLDFFEERIWPLFDKSVSRSSGETYEYHFLGVKAGTIGGEACISGRLIQRMKLRARQRVSRDGKITPSEDTLESDPSSLFVLRLYDHKLLVIPEQPRSPKTGTFRWIFGKLLDDDYSEKFRELRRAFLKELGRERLSQELELEFRYLMDANYPKITFHLTTIGDKESASELLKKFDIVQSVTITARTTNNEDYELDEEMLRKQKKVLEQLGGTSSDLVVRNASDGLKKEKVKTLVNAAVESGGNTAFKVRGKGPAGEKINKSESDAQVKVSIPVASGEADRTILEKALAKFDTIVASGVVKLAEVVNGAQEKRKSEALLRKLRTE